MDAITGTRAERFALVRAAHRFLVTALPLNDVHSRQALADFVEQIDRCSLPAVEIDAVLLRCLSALGRGLGPRSDLIEVYLASQPHTLASVRFKTCVEGLLRYRGVGHPHVRQAIAIIEERSHDPGLRQRTVAAAVGLRTADLAARFKAATALTFGEYLRNVRLDRAAALLASTTKSIKEVWVESGYNHASNFDHDFKRRHHVTPTEYRASVSRPVTTRTAVDTGTRDRDALPQASAAAQTVLIIDDDIGTRETIGQYLRLEGYRPILASTGREGLLQAVQVDPDRILLDYHLPDMDGLTCLRMLRRDYPSLKATVVLFTADWEVEVDSGELRALGATLASKLCDLEEILRLIKGR